MLMGGDRSMGPGGYARTPIEEVSPVAFDLKEEKRRASLAEVIAIDYSGSMGMMVSGQTKLALANEAAARSASLLGSGDRLGVEHVDTVVAWTIPLGPVDRRERDRRRRSARSASAAAASTPTSRSTRATRRSKKRSVNLKHLLLFADGDDAEQIAGCRAIVTVPRRKGSRRASSRSATDTTPRSSRCSRKLGGGRFYLIDDATKLPAVFTQETILAARSSIKEEPFKVSVGAPVPATRNVDFKEAPQLRGYVVTVPKARATVALERSGERSDLGDVVRRHRTRGGVHERLQRSLGRAVDEVAGRREDDGPARARHRAQSGRSARAARERRDGRRASRARGRRRRRRARANVSQAHRARRGARRILARRVARGDGRRSLRRVGSALAARHVRRDGERREQRRGRRHDRRGAQRGRRAPADGQRSLLLTRIAR